MIKVFIAGATGWAGSELSKGVFQIKPRFFVYLHSANDKNILSNNIHYF